MRVYCLSKKLEHFNSFLAVIFEVELNSMRYYRAADLYIEKYIFIILVDITTYNAYSVGQAPGGGTAQ